MTRQLLDMTPQMAHIHINQWQLIIIVSTAIRHISDKTWTYYSVAVNLNPNHHLYFYDCINKIEPYVKTGETAYFWKYEESYYNDTMCI